MNIQQYIEVVKFTTSSLHTQSTHPNILEHIGRLRDEPLHVRLVDGRQLHERRWYLNVSVRNLFVLLGHAIGARGRLFQVGIVIGEELQFVFEEIIDVANRCAQIDLVRGLAEAAHEAAE